VNDRFKIIRSRIVHSKMYMQRSMTYLTILNSAMLLLTVMHSFNLDRRVWFIPTYILGVAGLLLWGYAEDKLGFHREERKMMEQRNPLMKEVLERLERMEAKL
jgi:hypothetical protein